MTLTAVIITFYEQAVLGALLVALGVFGITMALTRSRRNQLRAATLLSLAWFFLTLFAIQAYLGIRVSSVEVVSYDPAEASD